MHNREVLEIKPCPECGGDRVIVSTVVRGLSGVPGNLTFQQQRRSPSLGFSKNKKSNTSSSQALVCTNCGYTAFYALQPDNLIPDQDHNILK